MPPGESTLSFGTAPPRSRQAGRRRCRPASPPCPSGQHLRVADKRGADDAPRRARGQGRGTQAGRLRGARAAASTSRTTHLELGVARSRDAASTCPGVPPSARDPQPAGPSASRRRRRSPRVPGKHRDEPPTPPEPRVPRSTPRRADTARAPASPDPHQGEPTPPEPRVPRSTPRRADTARAPRPAINTKASRHRPSPRVPRPAPRRADTARAPRPAINTKASRRRRAPANHALATSPARG
jgi:hypothetical protein